MIASIVIRAYNSESTIQRAVRSALAQDLPGTFEILVVDDGSSDRTREKLEVYQSTPNVRVIHSEHHGASAAANTGFRASRGKYVVLLDSDDFFDRTFLDEMVGALEQNPRYDFTYPDYYERDANTRVLVSPKHIFETVAGGMLFRRSNLVKAGFWRLVSFAEYDLLLRMKEVWRGLHIQKPLFTYMRRSRSLTKNKIWYEAALAELRVLHPDKAEDVASIRKY